GGRMMRVANAAVDARPWRIHEIAPDFTVEDVWALPAHGDADEFPSLLNVMLSLDFPDSASLPVRVLWGARDLLGRWFHLGRIAGPTDRGADRPAGEPRVLGPYESSLVDQLPDDLRHTAADLESRATPFFPLYLTDDEYAAELSNRTVHGVMHLAWVDTGGGRYQGQMAVYVKPRGRFGQAYMSFIKPFRYWVVYPALMRHIERAWNRRDASLVAAS
ncbi:MAG: DUF2867 domain-containing protein, partial [Acidimicrobiales bacterium]